MRAAVEWRAERDKAERLKAAPRLVTPQMPPLDQDADGDQPPAAPIKEAQSGESAPDVAELTVISAATFADKPIPPRRWIVPDMIPDRTVSIVAGDGGDGKTTLLLQLAVSIAGARPWLGHNPESGSALFVTAEDDIDEIHRRLVAIANSLDVALANLGDLHVVSLAGKDAVMAAPHGKAGTVTATSVFRGLVAQVEQIRPHLVILDALADVFGGEENARSQARQFIGLLRGLAINHDLAVVLIAHPSLTGMSSGSGTSGSTAWSNSVRSRLYLERFKGGDEREIDPDMRVLRVKKSNYGPAGLELRLRWSNGSFILNGSAGSLDKLAAYATAERIFLDLLRAFIAQGRDVSPNPSKSYAPTVFARHPSAEGITSKALEAAMERLLSADRVKVETFGPPSKQRKRLLVAPPTDDEP
jgi:RecA-family ATPase